MKSKFILVLSAFMLVVLSSSAQPGPDGGKKKNKSGYSTAKHGKAKSFHRKKNGDLKSGKKKDKI